MKKTTLKEIKKARPCTDGWEKLLKSLGKTRADSEGVTLEYILESNGLGDACWVADKVMNLDREIRLFAYWNAKNSKKYVEDKKVYNKVINTVNLYAYGEVGASARASARDSARASAWDSAGDSAGASARDSAWDSAWDSAGDSTWASAWDSAGASAWASAWDSARASAGASAGASARDSAWDSAGASYLLKADKAFIDIVCNGNLPAKVKTTNHF